MEMFFSLMEMYHSMLVAYIIRIQAHLQIEHTLNANGVGITSLK